jgi:hypothetical protein
MRWDVFRWSRLRREKLYGDLGETRRFRRGRAQSLGIDCRLRLLARFRSRVLTLRVLMAGGHARLSEAVGEALGAGPD